jgi:hypothetical protein
MKMVKNLISGAVNALLFLFGSACYQFFLNGEVVVDKYFLVSVIAFGSISSIVLPVVTKYILNKVN